jgi:hypothetical protein
MQRAVRSAATAVLLIGLSAAFMALAVGPALAHEEKEDGPYHLAVGFGDEPAYAGFKNSVQLLLSTTKNDQPVVNLKTDELKVTVEFGSQSLDLQMEPLFEVGEFGTPGDYRAFFIPTRPGTYAFHLTGSLNGTPIDQTFTSGPQTFSDVLNPSDIQFPVKDPSVSDVATRVERDSTRFTQDVSAANRSADSARDRSGTASVLGIVGIAVGVVGLLVAVAAVLMARRPHPVVPASPTPGPSVAATREPGS